MTTHRRGLAFALLVLWCVSLYVLRVGRTGSLTYLFLVANLFLASIPFFAALIVVRARGKLLQGTAAAIWLLFLPNAPYLITDFVHLRARSPVPLWYDIVMVTSFAATGLLFGFASLAELQRLVARRVGTTGSWLFVSCMSMLCGLGVYLGRFRRWNSWDAVIDPFALSAQLAELLLPPWRHPLTLAVTGIYGVGMLVGYFAFTSAGPDSANPLH